MTDEEWLNALRKLARKQSNLTGIDPSTLRVAMAEVCLLMAEAPTAITDQYYDLHENDLDAGATAQHDQIDAGDWTWQLDDTSSYSLALGIGIRARGLDSTLAHETAHDGPTDNPNVDYFCEDANAYVIPRTPVPWQDGHGSRRFFRRRGIVFHRVIPKKVGSFVQELYRLDGFDCEPDRDRPLGAAMFERFRLVYEGDGETLRILGVECEGAERSIDRQVSAAVVAHCSAIVWPELTMPPTFVEALGRRLEQEALSSAPASGPNWVLAGSWNNGNPASNVAPILDGYGQRVFDCVKSIPYREMGLGREEMQPGYRVPILVTDRELIAFGICRDFCELGQQTPWSNLNVDLVVIPSMGDETTMQGHRSAAHLGAAGGQRAFVVQQRATTETGNLGWVLPPTSKPGSLEIAAMEQGAWSEHLHS